MKEDVCAKGKRETLDFLIRGLFLSWHTIRKVFFLYQNFDVFEGEKNMSTQTNTAEKSTQKIGARTLALVGMLSAVAVVLMTFDIPLPFAPTFYKIDFSEVPVLIGCFTMGPLAGVGIELIKNLLHIVISGTQTAGVGEVANFLIGCAFIVPAGLIYHKSIQEQVR